MKLLAFDKNYSLCGLSIIFWLWMAYEEKANYFEMRAVSADGGVHILYMAFKFLVKLEPNECMLWGV